MLHHLIPLVISIACSILQKELSTIEVFRFQFSIYLNPGTNRIGPPDFLIMPPLSISYLNTWRNINSQILRCDLINFLLLGLHDIWQGRISRLVEAEVGWENSWKVDVDRFQSTVDLTNNSETAVVFVDLGGIDALQREDLDIGLGANKRFLRQWFMPMLYWG